MSLRRLIASLVFFAVLLSACKPLPLPVIFFLDKKIFIKNDQVKTAANNILTRLKEINPEKPCSEPFANWLKKQFEKGLVPKRFISSFEYGVDPALPNAENCKTIDIETEFRSAAERAADNGELKTQGYLIEILDQKTRGKLKKEIEEGGVVEDFINEDRQKIEIRNLTLEISQNNLNIPLAPYKIYVTAKGADIDKTALEEADAEKTLLEEGKILLLGVTPQIPAGFNGTLPVNMEQNFDDVEAVRKRLISLTASVLLIPPPFNGNPEIKVIGDKSFFVVPSGGLAIRISVEAALGLELADLRKELERKKKQIREESN